MTIRVRAPLRLSFAGGGTDVSPYNEHFGGRVVSATIDRFAYVFLETVESGVAFKSYESQEHEWVSHEDTSDCGYGLQLPVGVYDFMIKEFNGGKHLPLRICTQVDAPPGSGLGGSSALTVALVAGLSLFMQLDFGPQRLASLAHMIERKYLGFPGGWQDHYSAAFGGVNYFEHQSGANVSVERLALSEDIIRELEASILLFFTGIRRNSEGILTEQAENVRSGLTQQIQATHRVRDEAWVMRNSLLSGDIAEVVHSFDRGWASKKTLAREVSDPVIDDFLRRAIDAGAYTGKVSGAGGGGFLFLLTPPVSRSDVATELESTSGGAVSSVLFHPSGVTAWDSSKLRLK